MHIDALLDRRQDCLLNCPEPLPCSICSADEDCIRINRDCVTCGKTLCEPKAGAKASGGGVSKGALAGAVVGVILFLACSVAIFLWYRRRSRMKKALESSKDVKDVPAPAATVLNRPDPIEKPPSTIDEVASLEPPYVFSRDANPFDDGNSIQTAGTGGTNVIPIALVPPVDQQASIRSGSTGSNSSLSSGPIRPARSPELTLNYDHVNVSENNLHPGNYEASTRSGVSAVSSARNSYMSGMTYASDFIEAPMIITPTKGPIRQVLGVAKPEVISAGTLSRSPSNSSTLRPPAYSKPSAKSPLAATSFGPSDVVQESEEHLLHPGDPFDDRHSTNAEYSISPPPTATTMYTTRQDRDSAGSTWTPDGPTLPWARSDDNSRPSSLSTQAGSVIDIASATRVNVGLMTPGTANSGKTTYRTTMGRLVTPSSGPSADSLQEQQARALAHAQAQAEAQGLPKPRPISGSSAISAASTRADSILESFPFVPPSPISNRPIRSPPVSPLAQSFGGAATSPLAQHTFVVAPPSPQVNTGFSSEHPQSDEDGSLPAPNRKVLGMSTASQLSTASTGLGSFPFQIDSGSDRPDSTLQAPMPFNRQRASLDTLALTSDLSSYPLGFDRAGAPPPRKDKI